MAGFSDAELERIVAACNSAVWWLQFSDGTQLAPTPHLSDAPLWAVESTYDSIRAVLDGTTPEQLWEHWAAAKRKDGWKYGAVKDPAAKTHPCLVDDYAQLPAREHFKDDVFLGIIRLARQGEL